MRLRGKKVRDAYYFVFERYFLCTVYLNGIQSNGQAVIIVYIFMTYYIAYWSKSAMQAQ